MSSRVSVATPFELPSRLWADRVADGVGWVSAIAVAWVGSRHGTVPLALAAGSVTALALWLAGRSTRMAGPVVALPGAATRRLGPTLVVEGRLVGTGRMLAPIWLTPHDVPPERLRRLWVRLRAASRKSDS